MTKVVVSIEFESNDPVHDSSVVIDLLKNSLKPWAGSDQHRYRTTHPEEH